MVQAMQYHYMLKVFYLQTDKDHLKSCLLMLFASFCGIEIMVAPKRLHSANPKNISFLYATLCLQVCFFFVLLCAWPLE